MSPREAAENTGINKLTILKWIKTGRLVAEQIKTTNGPGYDIRPEDLTQALQKPRKKREPTPPAVRGSVVEELQTMRELIERQGEEARAREEAMRAELHDLRAQLYQTEGRLAEALRTLPAPKPTTEDKPGILSRFFKRGQP